MKIFLTALLALLLTACSSAPPRPVAVTDTDLNGTWVLRKAELGGKDFKAPGFELTINGTKWSAGITANGAAPNDFGTLVLFGDELGGEARRVDVIGTEGPNKGKRYPAIYRLFSHERELEVCYDLSGQDRPSEFVSREGTMLFRVRYTKK